MNPADACSTICGPLIDPPQPAESVPVNLGVWVDSSAGGATALAFETDDQPVLFATLSEQRLGNDSVYTVVLDDELLPNTDYVVTPLSRRWEQPEQGPFVAMGPSTRPARRRLQRLGTVRRVLGTTGQ